MKVIGQFADKTTRDQWSHGDADWWTFGL